MTYDRSITMFDESHSPEKLERLMKDDNLHKGTFLGEANGESYLTQMRLIAELSNCKRVLEFGPGENFVGRNLESIGYVYHTVDCIDLHKPTFLSTLEEFDSSRFRKDYDITCAFQILEHVPYETCMESIRKLADIARSYIVISVPYSCVGTRRREERWAGQGQCEIAENVDDFQPTGLPNRKVRDEYLKEFPWAHHFWEIGRGGLTVNTFLADAERNGGKILKHFHGHNPFHYFVVMAV